MDNAADSERTAVAQAWAANARSDWPEALGCWEAIRMGFPDNPAGFLGGGVALRSAGRREEAEHLLDEGRERFPDHEQIAVAHAWLANARRDWPEAESRWDAILARFPDNPRSYLGAANAFTASGRPELGTPVLARAPEALERARASGMDEATALAIEFDIARARHDWPGVRASAQALIGAEPEPRAQVLLALAQACWHLGDIDAADSAAEQALQVDPALSDAVLVRAWVATDRGDGEAALAFHRRLVEINPNTVRWALKLVQLLNWLGRVDEAVNLLAEVRGRWPKDSMVRVFLQNFGAARAPALAAAEDETHPLDDRTPGAAEWKRPVLVNDPASDLVVAEAPGARTVVLVFTGSNDGVSFPLVLFDRYLAALGVTAIYLKDFNRLRFLQGVRSLGDYGETLAALRDRLDRLGAERLCVIGNCTGGFAAIRYGVELNADHILAFEAPTFSPDERLSKLEQARGFMRRRLAASALTDMADLRPLLTDGAYPGRIEMFFDDDNDRNRMHALHLADLPGIGLHPQSGQSPHGVLLRLALSGDLRAMLGEYLGIEAA